MSFGRGDMVDIFVHVGNNRVKTGRGIVVAAHSGYCDVDHCYPHAAPFIYPERNSHLERINKEDVSKMFPNLKTSQK